MRAMAERRYMGRDFLASSRCFVRRLRWLAKHVHRIDPTDRSQRGGRNIHCIERPAEVTVPERLTRAVFLMLFAIEGCGGAIVDSSDADGGNRRDAGRSGGERDARSTRPPGLDARAADDFPVFRDDACADAPFTPPMLECDPFAPTATCLFDQG